MRSLEANRPTGRLIVITQGARWPSWLLRYRDLGPGDAVVAYGNGEAMPAFLGRVRLTVRELEALGVGTAALFLCLPESRDTVLEEAEQLAREFMATGNVGEIVLVSCGVDGARDGRRLQHLQRALHKIAKGIAVRVEAPRPLARKAAEAAYTLVQRLHPS